jgi:hypothetical protein
VIPRDSDSPNEVKNNFPTNETNIETNNNQNATAMNAHAMMGLGGNPTNSASTSATAAAYNPRDDPRGDPRNGPIYDLRCDPYSEGYDAIFAENTWDPSRLLLAPAGGSSMRMSVDGGSSLGGGSNSLGSNGVGGVNRGVIDGGVMDGVIDGVNVGPYASPKNSRNGANAYASPKNSRNGANASMMTDTSVMNLVTPNNAMNLTPNNAINRTPNNAINLTPNPMAKAIAKSPANLQEHNLQTNANLQNLQTNANLILHTNTNSHSNAANLQTANIANIHDLHSPNMDSNLSPMGSPIPAREQEEVMNQMAFLQSQMSALQERLGLPGGVSPGRVSQGSVHGNTPGGSVSPLHAMQGDYTVTNAGRISTQTQYTSSNSISNTDGRMSTQSRRTMSGLSHLSGRSRASTGSPQIPHLDTRFGFPLRRRGDTDSSNIDLLSRNLQGGVSRNSQGELMQNDMNTDNHIDYSDGNGSNANRINTNSNTSDINHNTNYIILSESASVTDRLTPDRREQLRQRRSYRGALENSDSLYEPEAGGKSASIGKRDSIDKVIDKVGRDSARKRGYDRTRTRTSEIGTHASNISVSSHTSNPSSSSTNPRSTHPNSANPNPGSHSSPNSRPDSNPNSGNRRHSNPNSSGHSNPNSSRHSNSSTTSGTRLGPKRASQSSSQGHQRVSQTSSQGLRSGQNVHSSPQTPDQHPEAGRRNGGRKSSDNVSGNTSSATASGNIHGAGSSQGTGFDEKIAKKMTDWLVAQDFVS